MKAKNISYPYPVIGNGDDVPSGSFKPVFKHTPGREHIACKVRFELKNKTLEKLVAKKKAAFTVELECGSTFFRTAFRTFDKQTEFSLDANRVREMVGVSFYVRAVEAITSYLPDGCHSDYEGFAFDIGQGDVLAIGGFTSFDAEKDFDPLRPSVSSFITIDGRKDKRGPMTIDYSDHDKIIIRLSQEDWSNYKLAKGRKSYTGVLHAGIVLPVLADAIRLVQKGEDEVKGNYWFQRLDVILRQRKQFEAEPLMAAQEIIKNPLERALAGLSAPSEEEE